MEEVKEIKKISKKTKIVISVVAVVVVVLAAGLVVNFTVIQPKVREYNSAVELYDKGEYEDALKTFTELGKFKDSSNYVSKCNDAIAIEKKNASDYAKADKLLQEQDYLGAKEIFESLGDYNDSQAKAESCQKQYELYKKNKKLYKKAVSYKKDCEYDEAIKIFQKLGNFEDSKEQIESCKSEKADWGKMTLVSLKGYDVVVDLDGYLSYLFVMSEVENATGYEVSWYDDSNIKTFYGNCPKFQFNTQADEVAFVKVRAFKSCKDGNTLYGDWVRVDINSCEVKDINYEELDKIATGYNEF